MEKEVVRRVVYICLSDGVVLLDDDQMVPITNFFDESGEECDDLELTVAILAGPCQSGKWYALYVSDYEKLVTN